MRNTYEFKGYRACVIYDAVKGAFVYKPEADPALAALGVFYEKCAREPESAAGVNSLADQSIDIGPTFRSDD